VESPRLPKKPKTEQSLARRVQQLEDTVRDQAAKITELQNLVLVSQTSASGVLRPPILSPLPDMPPSVGRSVSQAFWESRSDSQTLISTLNPGSLQREMSTSSFFELPKF